MTTANLELAFLAGILSTLSPCVLPLVPLLLGTAASEHRFGPVALAVGLALSFTAIGIFVATAGFAMGLDSDALRPVAATLLIAVGAILVFSSLQQRITSLATPFSNWVNQRFAGQAMHGLSGQFGVGLLLGAVWSPCVGPTLGAASLLATQGKDLGQVSIAMMSFGMGAALPLLALGMLSRQVLSAWRGRMMQAGHGLKVAMGLILAATGFFVLTGLDKTVETVLVDYSPAWLTTLTTQF